MRSQQVRFGDILKDDSFRPLEALQSITLPYPSPNKVHSQFSGTTDITSLEALTKVLNIARCYKLASKYVSLSNTSRVEHVQTKYCSDVRSTRPRHVVIHRDTYHDDIYIFEPHRSPFQSVRPFPQNSDPHIPERFFYTLNETTTTNSILQARENPYTHAVRST